MNIFRVFLGILVVAILLGCGPASTSTNGDAGPKIIQTEGLEPTPTPTVDPEIMMQQKIDEAVAKILKTLITPTSVPASTHVPVMPTATLLPAATPAPTPTAEPSPTRTPLPTRTPTPTPKPIIRPVAPPEGTGIAQQLIDSFSVSIANDIVRVSGTIEGQSYEPTYVQVWQARDSESYSDTCSTERPVAFIRPGNGDGGYTGLTSPYEWVFCTGGYSQKPITDNVPWMQAKSWSYELQYRKYIYDPYVYDFSAIASIDHELVERLEYGEGVYEGWRVVVFSGDTIIGSKWLYR